MQICRICMNTNRKMYPFNSKRLHLYEEITTSTNVSHDLLPQYVCWECGYHMSKYVDFRSKVLRSLYIFTEILSKEGQVTESNCGQFKMKSNLILTDVVIEMCTGEENNLSGPSSSDVKMENVYIGNNITNFIDVKNELTHDFIDDNQYSDVITADDLIPSPLSISTIKNKDSNKKVNKKAPEKHSRVKTKGKTKVRQVIVKDEKKNSIKKTIRKNKGENNRKSHSIKTVERGCAETKPVPTAKDKKINDIKSLLDEIDKTIINVAELTLDEQIAEVQDRIESDNYKNSPYKCEKCFKGFLDSDTFDRHLVKHSESSGAFECPLCRTRHLKLCRLTEHMKSHLYRFSCLQCNFCARSVEVAKKHQDYHKGKRHTCPHCKEVYTYLNSLLSHIRIKHPSDIICRHCGLSFLNDKGLNKHVKWVHRGEEQTIPEDGPRCTRCDVTFSTQEALDKHVQVSGKHADERNGTSSRNALKSKNVPTASVKKLATHTSAPYPDGPRCCEQCDEKLPNPRAYFHHFKNAHKDKNRTVFYGKNTGDRHMCEICGRMFQSASLLRHHKYVHSDTKQFKCERCGKQFQLELHLWSHQRNHCGTRRSYPCSVCGKNFASESNRARHMVVHKGYSFKCELCEKVFSCPYNRKNHIDFVHKKKPWPKRNRGPRKRPERQPEAMLQNQTYEADMQEDWNTP